MHRDTVVVLLLLSAQAVLAAIIAADPATLGLNPRIVAWLAVFNVPIGIILNQLKAVGDGE